MEEFKSLSPETMKNLSKVVYQVLDSIPVTSDVPVKTRVSDLDNDILVEDNEVMSILNPLDSDLFGKLPETTSEEEYDGYKREIKEESSIYDDYYLLSEEDGEPASESDLDDFQAEFIALCQDTFKQKDVHKRRINELLEGDSMEEPLVGEYDKDTAVFNGEKFPFKRVTRNVDWGNSFVTDYPYNNLLKLKSLVTKGIEHGFGGFDRVTTLQVYQGQLIINGICYMPVISKENIDKLPLDTAEYLQNNCLAYLFDWAYLPKLKNLDTIYIDDVNFYTSIVAVDLGRKRRITTNTLFKICKKLRKFVLGSDVICPDGKVEQEPITPELAKTAHFNGILDGYKSNFYGCTEGFKEYAFNNLKNYATNRGDKKLVRYCGGVLSRFGVASFSALFDLSSHLVGGIFKGITSLFK